MTIPLIGITSNEKPVEEGSPIIHLSVSTLFADGVKRAGGLPSSTGFSLLVIPIKGMVICLPP